MMLARLVLGGAFVWHGIQKALDPVLFLKLLRQYDLPPALLNEVAAVLPWFEIFCGLLLLLGLARRGSALLALSLLLAFSFMVGARGAELGEQQGLAFCDVAFDCGCGSGVVNVCAKLLENTGLSVLALIVLWKPR